MRIKLAPTVLVTGLLFAVQSVAAPHAWASSVVSDFVGTISYDVPGLVIGPNCAPVSWSLSGGAIEALLDTELVGGLNVSGSGASSCANYLGESGTARVAVNDTSTGGGKLACASLAGGYVRTPAYYVADLAGTCTVFGVPNQALHLEIVGEAVPTGDLDCCPQLASMLVVAVITPQILG